MIRDPIAEWQELSSLYEQAEALEGDARQAWLQALPVTSVHLRGGLERMLAARDRAADEGFLEDVPAAQSETAAVTAWATGARVGPYRLIRPIGEGGMAEVWLAARVDGAFERTVAIKLPFDHPSRAQRESFAERFRRERDIVASLDHPNIAALHDAGVTAGGQPWLALEYVEGEPITAWCDRRQASIESRIDIFRQVLVAVEHAHANLVIHRDLKPANILVTEAGEVKLLDFGIAKLLQPSDVGSDDSELTRQGGRPMTLKYASPEQFSGRPLTTASDQYSLGVVLYELLCGESPYEGRLDSAGQIEEAVTRREPRAPSRRALGEAVLASRHSSRRVLARLLAADLEAVPLAALCKEPHERYRSIEAVRLDLERWQQRKPLQVKLPTAAYRLHKFVRRHPLGVVSGSLATLALVGVTVGAVAMEMRARREADRAIAAGNFIAQVFRMADPETGAGNPVTAKALLEGGRRMAAIDLQGEPEIQANVLSSIGQMQNYLGLYPPAVSTYQQAADIYASRGMSRDWAMTMSYLATNLVRQGDVEQAREAVDKAAAAATRRQDDHVLLAKVRQVQGEVANGLGDPVWADKHMREALAQAQLAYGRDDARTLEPLRYLSDTQDRLGHEREALMLLDRAASIAAAASGHARERVTIDNDRAGLQLAYGHYSAAAQATELGLPRCDRLLTAGHDDCVYTAQVRAAALLGIGDVSAAAKLLPRLLAASANGMSPSLQMGSLGMALRVVAAGGAAAKTGKDLEKRLGELIARPAGLAYDRAIAAIAIGEARLAAGDLAGALRWSMEAGRFIAGAPVPDQNTSGRARILEAVAYQCRGDHQKALNTFAAAQVDLAAGMGVNHPMLAYWALNEVSSLIAVGSAPAALRRIDTATVALAREIESTAPFWKRIDSLKFLVNNSTARSAGACGEHAFL